MQNYKWGIVLGFVFLAVIVARFHYWEAVFNMCEAKDISFWRCLMLNKYLWLVD